MSVLINSLEELTKIVKHHRAVEQTIVFTNGCFDLLHEGHFHLLNESKKLGEILILGINTDSSIKKLKGDTRPIQKLAERIDAIKKKSIVDYIITFDDDTPIKLIEIIEPDFLVKGGDYQIENIVGNKLANKTIIIPLLEGFSTTQQINKLKR